MAKASSPSRNIPFKPIRARAEKRKGGAAALETLLPKAPDMKALAKVADDRILAEMTQRVFSAGFAWSVIENKWPDFEKAFLGFKPAKLVFQPDDFWDALLSDTRIVRNGAKIASVRENAAFVHEIAKEHGGFGNFLAKWPSSDQIGLLDLLAKRDVAAEVKSKGDRAKVQAQFNAWADETGLPYLHLSRICAMSTGENRMEQH